MSAPAKQRRQAAFEALVRKRVTQAGAAFPCEIYRIPREIWDAKVAAEPPGLVVGEIALDDGSTAIGMLADPAWLATLEGVTDITAHGGWAAFAANRD